MSRATRVVLPLAVLVVAVVLFIVLKPSDDKKQSKPQIQTITVKNAKPVGGVQDITANKGDTVRFKVVSDVADEVHLHGYDLHKDVKPGHPVTFSFKAKLDGEFEAELESRKEQILALKVNP
jgi:heme/copper-type cytochrome/quinol oxidase subunit 2